MTTKGELVNWRHIKQPRCAGRVKYKCLNNVPEQQREKIYNDFHKLSSLSEQRPFLVKHVTVRPTSWKVTKAVESRRAFTKTCTFATENGTFHVCREFFLDTLNISESLIRGALKKVSWSGILLPDLRGEKRTSKESNGITLCKKKFEYQYLDSALNVTIMHNLYKEKCIEDNKTPVSFEKYRRIFRESTNSNFINPKKIDVRNVSLMKSKGLTLAMMIPSLKSTVNVRKQHVKLEIKIEETQNQTKMCWQSNQILKLFSTHQRELVDHSRMQVLPAVFGTRQKETEAVKRYLHSSINF